MLAEPQVMTINSVANNFYKVAASPNSSQFVTSDGLKAITTKQNSTAKRFRREVRISQSKVAADPVSAVNAMEGVSVYLVIDEPRSGVFTDAEINHLATALCAWQGTGNFTQLLRGEF